MKNILFSWIVRKYLKEFVVLERELSEGEYSAAMNTLVVDKSLQKLLNITLSNLIRRHLYIKDMNEGSWYLGQIAALRKLQTDAENWRIRNEKELSQ